MRRLVCIFFWMSLLAAPVFGSTHAAANCTASGIQAAVDASSNGDDVTIPDCTATDITTTVTVSTGIRVHGLHDCTWGAVPPPGSNATPPSTPTCTTILGNAVTSGPMFLFNCDAGEDWRIDDIKFVAGSGQSVETTGLIVVYGQDKGWRVDHNWFSNPFSGRTIFIPLHQGWTYGLKDHNYEDYTTHSEQGIEIFMDLWGGKDWGDGSWSADLNMGSTAAMYIENNYIKSIFPGRAYTDGGGGARLVVRFNTIFDDFIGTHGTESTLRDRGVLYVEAYGNDMANSTQDNDKAVFLRSGTAMFFKNKTDGYISGVRAFDYRACARFTPFGPSGGVPGASDGTSVYDNNVGGLIASGMHTGSNGATVLTDSGGSFASLKPGFTYPGRGFFGQDHSVINITKGWSSFIKDSTATTVTSYSPDFCVGGSYTWDLNDSYEIRSAYPTLDQIGFGKGDLLTGGSDTTQPTPVAWPNQAATPVYSFLNAMTNVDGTYPAYANDTHLMTTRDLIVDNCAATPCVTTGTLAAMPGSCSGTVAGYWANNVGSWNDGSNPTYTGQGALYRCNGSTYVLYYTPANFPFSGASCVPDHLAWDTQPSNAGLGGIIGTLQISVYSSGNVKCTDDTSTVTIAKKGGTCTGMTLNGTVSGAASSGTFTTSNVTLTVATGSCTLTATDGALTSADSNAFTITSVAPGSARTSFHR